MNEREVQTSSVCTEMSLNMICTKYTSAYTRLSIVKKTKLCYNCLCNHKLSDYKSAVKCRKCHHTRLCKKTDETEKLRNRKQHQSSAIHSSLSKQMTSSLMLKTATASVRSDVYSSDANILLD